MIYTVYYVTFGHQHLTVSR